MRTVTPLIDYKYFSVKISTQPSPPLTHLAIIMDGNGRWAKARGLSRSEGHKAGTKTAQEIVSACLQRGIKHLTLYTFSTENWKRPADEVRYIFSLLVEYIHKELPHLEKRGVKLTIVGEPKGLPFATRQALAHAQEKTRHCDQLTLHLALNYSAREEILHACKLCLEKGVQPKELTQSLFASCLYTKDIPDPELIIRTGGELRLSNFLLYQAAYSELYFTDIAWPDFTSEALDKALNSFIQRERRFGGLSSDNP